MSIRRLLILAAAAGSLAVGVAGPVDAATTPPSVPPSCNYTPQRPKLTLIVTPKETSASHRIAEAGTLKVGSCPIRNAAVSIQHRPVVSGKPSGSWVTIRKPFTDSKGTYSTSFRVYRNQQVRAVFKHTNGFSTAVSPTPYPVALVHTRLTMTVSKYSKCRLHFTGTTLPAKVNRTVYIQKRGPKGHFSGYTTIGTATTNSKGFYSKTISLSCSKTYNLSAKINKDAINLYGRAPTVFGVTPKH